MAGEGPGLEARLGQLGQAARTLAMLGAALKTRHDPALDPRVGEVLATVSREWLGGEAASLEEGVAQGLLRMVEMCFAEAGELLQHPARPAAWQVTDPVLLQTQGQASARVFHRILGLAAARPGMRAALEGRFLDVGTGVGAIALEAARCCPRLRVDGIDIWEPALELARRQLAASAEADRVTICRLDVAALPPAPAYSLVWLPTMFMPRTVVEAGLDRIAAASAPGAYLVAARYTLPADPAAAAFVRLRTLRGGGEMITQPEMEAMLRHRGYTDIESDASPLATLTLGRRPA